MSLNYRTLTDTILYPSPTSIIQEKEPNTNIEAEYEELEDDEEDDSSVDITYIFSPLMPVNIDVERRRSISSSVGVGNSIRFGESSRLITRSIRSTRSIGKQTILRRYAGVLLALFATFIYSLATLILKLFHDYHPFTVSIWRFQGMIVPSIPIILYYTLHQKKEIFANIWPITTKTARSNIFYITLRSIIGCTSTVLQIYALQYLNMADASVIVFSSPIFVLFVARIFLKEKAGYFSIVIAVFTLCGVAVICRPPMLTGQPIDSKTLIGIGFALGSMLTSTVVFVILRHLKDVHYSVVTVLYGIEGSIECIILAVSVGVFELPRTPWDWALVVGLVMFTWGGQTALILALQLEQCGIVSLINSLDTCFAFTHQFVFLGVIPDKYSLIGASIVISGVLITTFRKYLAALPENNSTKQKFRILLY